MKLLIVDDELWSRQLIKNILNWYHLGFEQVFEAEDGEDAIVCLDKHNVDLTITDMRMPGMDGVKLLETLREKNYKTEVIVMSGYDEFDYIHEALKTKAVDYLLKPIVKEELLEAVKTGIDHINEAKSYHYIEEILEREDLKKEINLYYELKHQVFKALSTVDDSLLYKTIDKVEENYFLKDHKLLGQYIKMDLGRLITKWAQETRLVLEPQDWEKVSFDAIKQALEKVFKRIKETKVEKKLDILDIQKYIDVHYADAISLADIANQYYVSKEHLSRLFKKQVGETVQTYITQKRIAGAKRLLRKHQKISISTISKMSGYMDVQYFYRVFKRYTGMTPQDYKANDVNII